MQARLHSPTDAWSKLWCSFWHIINTLQQKKKKMNLVHILFAAWGWVSCHLRGLGGGHSRAVTRGNEVFWGEEWGGLPGGRGERGHRGGAGAGVGTRGSPGGVATPQATPLLLKLRPAPPGRQGALWAPPAPGVPWRLPPSPAPSLSLRGRRRHGECRPHPPQSSFIRRHPRPRCPRPAPGSCRERGGSSGTPGGSGRGVVVGERGLRRQRAVPPPP